MEQFDFERVERELDIVVPTVYRSFIEQALEAGIPLSDFGFHDSAEELIEENLSLREEFADLWQDGFLAVLPDGSGNWFTIVATSPEDDEVVTVAHDPYGVEETGKASDLFKAYLESTN